MGQALDGAAEAAYEGLDDRGTASDGGGAAEDLFDFSKANRERRLAAEAKRAATEAAVAPSIQPTADVAQEEEEEDPFDFSKANRERRLAAEAKRAAAEAAVAPSIQPAADVAPEEEEEDPFDFSKANRERRLAAEAKRAAAEAAAAPSIQPAADVASEEEEDPFDFSKANRERRLAAEAKRAAAEAAAAPSIQPAADVAPEEEEEDPFDFSKANRERRLAAEAKRAAAEAAPKASPVPPPSANDAPIIAAPEAKAVTDTPPVALVPDGPADDEEADDIIDIAALANGDFDREIMQMAAGVATTGAPAAPVQKKRWLRFPKLKLPSLRLPSFRLPATKALPPRAKLPDIRVYPKKRLLKVLVIGTASLSLVTAIVGAGAYFARDIVSTDACDFAGVLCPPDLMTFKNMKTAEIQAQQVRDSMRVTVNGRVVEIADASSPPRWVPILPLLKPGENLILVQIDSRTGPICTGTFSMRVNGLEMPALTQRWALQLADGRPGNCLTRMFNISLK